MSGFRRRVDGGSRVGGAVSRHLTDRKLAVIALKGYRLTYFDDMIA